MQLNPRKLAKHGFVNSDVNKINCTGCTISIMLRSHLNFSQDEAMAKNWMTKILKAHAPECIYKASGEKVPQPEFSLKEFDPTSFYIFSKKLFYVKWQEILVSLLKTFEDQVMLPEIHP